MKYYFAPMEGITGYVYRNAHRKFFKQVDVYFTPFIVPTQNRKFTSREKNDFLPEHNVGLHVIPQILTNKGENFIWAAKELNQFGYEEVNLNLGCPSPTVVSKGRGSGFLGEPELLDIFLDQIFSSLDMKISVKTRIGKDSPEEFGRLMEIYNKYPIEQLIIHPRIQKDFYRNEPNWEVMKKAVSLSRNPLCYNGNLFSAEDYKEFTADFPSINSVMLGRGMVANPGLAGEMKNGEKMDKRQLKSFHDEVLKGYEEIMSGDRNVLFKMKELWAYMIQMFDGAEKHGKKIRKSQHLADYRAEVDSLFGELDLKESAGAFDGK
ncbi:tRNA dihydrouridine synthase [Lacrimispora sp.]|jgi:tRNA-dihydrouridine synthase|uniref:tRNA dihydrouridine synthase n=2 Tax=Lacrimispora sp. TaxID=2719234 RepID=UPI0028981572|nr:tRNA-dihydrouridine synthase family protein [Lacrimispora sp.]